MSFVFSLRRAFDNGSPVSAAKVFHTAKGTLTYGEEHDERFHRVVRTAKFTRVDGGEPIPPLRNADPLVCNSLRVSPGDESGWTPRQCWVHVLEPESAKIRRIWPGRWHKASNHARFQRV